MAKIESCFTSIDANSTYMGFFHCPCSWNNFEKWLSKICIFMCTIIIILIVIMLCGISNIISKLMNEVNPDYDYF